MNFEAMRARLNLQRVLAAAVLAAVSLRADEAAPFPPGNPHGFELKLPPGWTAVDSNQLEWIRAARREQIAGLPAADGLYAYRRPDAATNEFDPPYVIVAIR